MGESRGKEKSCANPLAFDSVQALNVVRLQSIYMPGKSMKSLVGVCYIAQRRGVQRERCKRAVTRVCMEQLAGDLVMQEFAQSEIS